MALQNKKVSLVKENSSNDKIKSKLKEDYKKYLKEDDEDGLDDLSDEDLGTGDLDLGDDSDLDMSDDSDVTQVDDLDSDDDMLDSLTDEETEWFDSEVDSLLQPAEDQMIDTGEELGGLSSEELEDIINSDETYDDLGNTLSSAAKEVDDEEIDLDTDEDLSIDDTDDELDLDTDEDVDLEEELMIEAEIEEELQEAYKAAKRKQRIKENSLASSLKSIDFEEEDTDLEGIYSKLSDKVLQGKSKDSKFDKVSLATTSKFKEPNYDKLKQESIDKSKMLVKASEQIDSLQKKYKKLQLENYKLIKSNGLLASVGDKLDSQSRVKIVEGFEKCSSAKQISELYEKLTKVIKDKQRPSLNEAVQKTKSSVKTINQLKEGKEELNETENKSREQARRNYLMGVPGATDEYMSKF